MPDSTAPRRSPRVAQRGLIAGASAAILVQRPPRELAADGAQRPVRDPRWLPLGTFAVAIYGGYFGAAQGVILIGLLSALSTEPLQSLNGLKNVLGLFVNAVGSLVFIITAPDLIDWRLAALVGVGAILGGVLGSRYGRRLPPNALRAVIVVVGVAGLVKFVFFP